MQTVLSSSPTTRLLATVQKSVYLAGPVTGSNFDDANNWRSFFEELGNQSSTIKYINPLRGQSKEILKKEGFLDKDGVIQSTKRELVDNSVFATNKAISAKNRFDVTNCDAVLVNLFYSDRVSIGTMLEIGIATALNKPIILMMEHGNIHDHVMVNEYCHFRVTEPDYAKVTDIVYTVLGC